MAFEDVALKAVKQVRVPGISMVYRRRVVDEAGHRRSRRGYDISSVRAFERAREGTAIGDSGRHHVRAETLTELDEPIDVSYELRGNLDVLLLCLRNPLGVTGARENGAGHSAHVCAHFQRYV